VKTTYSVLHQGHVYRITRVSPVGYAIFLHSEHSLLVDKLLGWRKTERGAQSLVRQYPSCGVIVPVRTEEVSA